jgi:hypothetical protein
MKNHMRTSGTIRAGLVLLACGSAWSAPFERKGVTADPEKREVRIRARATGISAKSAVEFLLIGAKSGHEYEAIAISEAPPSDVHAAMEFIGLRPGQPIRPAEFRFWPRGPRVMTRIRYQPPDGPAAEFPAEETICLRPLNRTLPVEGFLFTGSQVLPGHAPAAPRVYAADEIEPCSILPLFNQAGSVFDLPRQGGQGELYETQYPNPARMFPANAPLEFILRPAGPQDRLPEPADFSCRVRAGKDRAPVFELTPGGGAPGAPGMTETLTMADAGAALKARAKDHLLYLAISFDPDNPVRLLRTAAAQADALVEEGVIRILPPPRGELFHKALIPDPSFRRRGERPAQPPELHLRRKGTAMEMTLVLTRRNHDSMTGAIEWETQSVPVPSPRELGPLFETHSAPLNVLLVIGPEDLTYGEVTRAVAALLPKYPVIHVFTGEEEPPQAAPDEPRHP